MRARRAVPDPHIILAGSTTPSDLDTCINDAFTSMAGKWHMRFSVSGQDGTVSQSQPTTLAAIGARPLPNPSSE